MGDPKIFVGGLPKGCTEQELSAYFQSFGTVSHAKIMMDQTTGASRGFAFVHFSDNSAVQSALAMYNDHTIRGKWVEVKHAAESPKGGKKGGKGGDKGGKGKGKGGKSYNSWDNNYNSQSNGWNNSSWETKPSATPAVTGNPLKIKVTNLPEEATEDDVSTYFGQFGTVKETVILTHVLTKESKSEGTVTFESAEVAKSAVDYTPHLIGENTAVVAFAPIEKKADPLDFKIHVTGIPKEALKEDIDNYFAQFGAVSKCDVPADDQGITKGFCFVTFEEAEVCKYVLEYNPHMFGEKEVKVTKPTAVTPATTATPTKGKAKGKGKGDMNGWGADNSWNNWDGGKSKGKGKGKGDSWGWDDGSKGKGKGKGWGGEWDDGGMQMMMMMKGKGKGKGKGRFQPY